MTGEVLRKRFQKGLGKKTKNCSLPLLAHRAAHKRDKKEEWRRATKRLAAKGNLPKTKGNLSPKSKQKREQNEGNTTT
jgi:hypothetical protein